MVILALGLLPFLLANLTAFVVSRRRPSPHLIITQGAAAIAIQLMVCACFLVPTERMYLYSVDGMFQISIGRTTLLLSVLLPVLCGLLFGLTIKEEALPPQKHRRSFPAKIIALFFLFTLLFFTQGYFWGKQLYSGISIDEIIFHLNMPLEGTAASFTRSVLHSVFLPALLALLPIAFLVLAPSSSSRSLVLFGRIRLPYAPLSMSVRAFVPLLILWLVLLLTAMDSLLNIRTYIRGYMTTSPFIDENYVAPDSVAITFPEEKRNLITILLESYESTNQDIENGGILSVNLIPEMTRIAKENVSFSRNEQITGAAVAPRCSWTISALVAQTAALPIMHIANNASSASELMPGAVTLGDILKEHGYRLMFLAGSDFSFGGRRTYYRQHGDYEIWDLLTAKEEGRLPQDYNENWGFEDIKLYEYAKEKLLELAKGDQPFHFSMLTADTHTPGYRCPRCPTDYENKGYDALNYADILRCSSTQLSEFLAWCQQQPFYENTTIVITGDHLSMQEFFYRNILGSQEAAENIERYVYNAYINAPVTPVQEDNRLFTTMDFFPTTLASLGVSIEGNRLGLGTNLFSEQQTLSEQYGEAYMFAELEKRSVYYDRVLFYGND